MEKFGIGIRSWMEELNFRFWVDAKSEIFDFWMDVDGCEWMCMDADGCR